MFMHILALKGDIIGNTDWWVLYGQNHEKNHIVYFCVLFIELTNYSLLMLYKEKGCIITKQSKVKKITKAFMKINLWITIKDFNLPYLTHESCKKKSWIWKKILPWHLWVNFHPSLLELALHYGALVVINKNTK